MDGHRETGKQKQLTRDYTMQGPGREPDRTMPLKPGEENIKRTSSTAFSDMERLRKWESENRKLISKLFKQFSKIKRSQGNIHEAMENNTHRKK